MLKWTYTYGFYGYTRKKEAPLRNLFEHFQGEAEACLEKLHYHIEVKLPPFYSANAAESGGGGGGGGGDGGGGDGDDGAAAAEHAEAPELTFAEYRSMLTGLTAVTRGYFERLVAELEGGLEGLGAKYAAAESP